MSSILLEVCSVTKEYVEGNSHSVILKGIDLKLHVAEQMVIVGSSGSGKSTLLHIMGTLDKPTTGKVLFLGTDLTAFKEAEVAKFRNQELGFIYQFHHLLPEFNALENIAMPALIAKKSKDEAYAKAKELLDRVGLLHRASHNPSELSGGERQRIAIARALINNPRIVLADEPTGNLDTANGQVVYDIMQELTTDLKTAFITVTHDLNLADKMQTKVKIVDGMLSEF